MKNKKIWLIFLIVLIIVLIGGYFAIKIVKNKKEQMVVEEYTPQAEITEEQERQTIVSLYFINKENNKLNPEAHLLDIKEIINNPYERLIQLLIEGPKSDKNKKIMPENTKLNKCYLEKDCVTLDFSIEFLNYVKENSQEKENLINCIVNTLTELSEVNKVKIVIDGKEQEEFKEIYQRKS